MAIQISYGDRNEFDALIYSEKDPRTISYLQQQVTNVSQTLTSAGAAFMAKAQNLFETFNSSEAMRIARAARAKASSMFQYEGVQSLWEIAKIQNASLTMQRWIMANPTVREMYHEQRIDGYSETYKDMNPGVIGDDHYDYRRATDGLVSIDEEGYEHVKVYIEDLLPGDRELDILEQGDIQSTWDIVQHLMKYGTRDATDTWDGKL